MVVSLTESSMHIGWYWVEQSVDGHYWETPCNIKSVSWVHTLQWSLPYKRNFVSLYLVLVAARRSLVTPLRRSLSFAFTNSARVCFTQIFPYVAIIAAWLSNWPNGHKQTKKAHIWTNFWIIDINRWIRKILTSANSQSFIYFAGTN